MCFWTYDEYDVYEYDEDELLGPRRPRRTRRRTSWRDGYMILPVRARKTYYRLETSVKRRASDLSIIREQILRR
ncbi:MAG: hypothetical protein M1838_004240, partial [Thelocarpon superellum]